MAEMITRCPHCGTAFRITPAHLKSARGSVRCGSCLQVFNAREHLSANAPEPAAAPPPPEKKEDDLDDLLISDDMEAGFEDEDEDESSDMFLPDEPAQTQASLFERMVEEDEDEDQDEAKPDDESWALKLLDEDDPTPAPFRARPTPPPESPQTEDQAQDIDERRRDEALVEAGEDEADDSWAAALKVTADEDSFATGLNAHRRDGSGNPYLDAIEPEPVEFAYREKRPFWRSRGLWALLALLALILLLAQVAWLQYPKLSRQEPYRSFYATACNLIGCELPPQRDLNAIRTSNLVVRSHPREPGALMVDVVLQNTAGFSQPFPDLELSFSDLHGDIVARRRFEPREYLGGELSGQRDMPIRQPVHVALEIVDPGANAVNYRVDVAPNAP